MSQDSATKIAVYSQDKFRALGYLPVTHPDGYVYFEKDASSLPDECGSSSDPVVEGPVDPLHISDPPRAATVEEVTSTTRASTSQQESVVSSLPSSGLFEDYPGNSADQDGEGDENNYAHATDYVVIKSEQLGEGYDETDTYDIDIDEKPTLRLQPEVENYSYRWKSEIQETGYASCSLPTCNFITPVLSAMLRHFTKCSGEPKFDRNLCSTCGRWLTTPVQRDIHSVHCKGDKFGAGGLPRVVPSASSFVSKTPRVKELPRKPAGIRKEPKLQTPTDMQIPCIECGETKLFPNVCKALTCSHNTPPAAVTESQTIVQPTPKPPPGTYLRRRAYTTVHKESWALKLAEKNYISCHFKDCLFIAMSVQDMCLHFGFCTGDSSFARFQCRYCGGLVTSERILKIHIKRSHMTDQLVSAIPMSSQSHTFRVVANKGIPQKTLGEQTFSPAVAPSFPVKVHPPKKVVIERRGDGYYIPNIIKKASVPPPAAEQGAIGSSDDNTDPGEQVCGEKKLIRYVQENEEQLSFSINSHNPPKEVIGTPSTVTICGDVGLNTLDVCEKQQSLSTVVDVPGLRASSQIEAPVGISSPDGYRKAKLHVVRKAREAKLKQEQEVATPLIDDSMMVQEFAAKSETSSAHLVSPRFVRKEKVVLNTDRIVVSESSDMSYGLISESGDASDFQQMEEGDAGDLNPAIGRSPQLDVTSPEVNHQLNRSSEMKVVPHNVLTEICDQGTSTASETDPNTHRTLKREHSQKCDQDRVDEGDLQVTFERKTVITDGRSLQQASTSTSTYGGQNPELLNSLNTEIGSKATLTVEPSVSGEDGRSTFITSVDLEEGPVQDGDDSDNCSDYACDADTVDGDLVAVGADEDKSEVMNCDIVAGPLLDAARQWDGNRLTESSILLEAAVVTPELVRTYETLVGTPVFSEKHPKKIMVAATTEAVVSPNSTLRDSELPPATAEESRNVNTSSQSVESTLDLIGPSLVETERRTNKKLVKSASECETAEFVAQDATLNSVKTPLRQPSSKAGEDVTLKPVPPKKQRGRPRRSERIENPESERVIRDFLGETAEMKPSGSKRRSHPQNSSSSKVKEDEDIDIVGGKRKSSRKKSLLPALSEEEMKPSGDRRESREKRNSHLRTSSVSKVMEKEKIKTDRNQRKINKEKSPSPSTLKKEVKPVESRRKSSQKRSRSPQDNSLPKTRKTRKRPCIHESGDESNGEAASKLLNRSSGRATNRTKTGYDSEVSPKLNLVNVKSEPTAKSRARKIKSVTDVEVQKSEASGSPVPTTQGTEARNYSEPEEGFKSTKAPKRRKLAEKNTCNGRGTKTCTVRPKPSPTMGECGKCGYVVSADLWDRHNATKHTGLGWLAGEPPIDQRTADSQQLLVRVRAAFRICKEATCSLCGVSKRSFLGFHAHILVCGKSEKEQQRAMIQCKECGKSLLPYSMASHMKTHSESTLSDVAADFPAGKRPSALRAISNLKRVIAVERTCVLYKKGNALPEISDALLGLFFENGVGKCLRVNCAVRSATAREATRHLFNCSVMPEEYYQCLECPFFALDNDEAVRHSNEAHNNDTELAEANDDYNLSTESDEDGKQSGGSRTKKGGASESLSLVESKLKKGCAVREKLFVGGPYKLYQKAFDMELQAQCDRLTKREEYPPLHTASEHWLRVENHSLPNYLPPLSQSLPMRHCVGGSTSGNQVLKVFEAFQDKGIVGGFVGGVVQTLAWCPTSIDRVAEGRQLLAISVASQMEEYPTLRTSFKTESLLQIWDFGFLNNKGVDEQGPRMLLGLAMDFGELWDVTWSPRDAWQKSDGTSLPRLGLVAAAFHDGAVRIFSISCPDTTTELVIYRVDPVVMLTNEDWSADDPCIRVSWEETGVICGGYRSGRVAVWQLSQISSGRVPKEGNTYIMKPLRSFHAGYFPITALAVCPSNPRLLVTGGADKKLQHWDLRSATVPLRVESCTPVQVLRWIRNWPALLYLAEENEVVFDLPPHLHTHGGHRFKYGAPILDLSFSDWTYLTAVGNAAGEVIFSYTSDPLHDFSSGKGRTKFSVVAAKAEVKEMESWRESRKEFSCYADVCEAPVGISFTDMDVRELFGNKNYKTSVAPSPAKYTVTSVQKVAFNPNYLTFNHLAIGYRFGVVRVLRLNHLEEDIDRVTSLASARIARGQDS